MRARREVSAITLSLDVQMRGPRERRTPQISSGRAWRPVAICASAIKESRQARNVLRCCGDLFLLAKGKGTESRDTVGLGPKAHHAGFRKRRILDLEQRLVVEDDFKAGAGNLDPQGVPLIGRHRRVYAIATLASDDVERVANTIHGLVEDDVVLKGVGPNDVVVVCILSAPDEPAGAILRTGNWLELHFD